MPEAPLIGARKVLRVLREHGHEAWLAGGCVRDHLLGLSPDDFDVATSATPSEVESLFRKTIAVGRVFGVVQVRLCGRGFEVATFRSDGIYADGRHPETVVFSDAASDVLRRDFTINGMLWDPESGEIRDYVGGREDLAARTVRAIGDADVRFQEDALRLLRAVRFAASGDFTLHPETEAAVSRHRDRLRNVSAERIREELLKMAARAGSRRGDAWRLLVRTGLAEIILPEAQATPDDHTLVLDRLSARSLPLFLATLLRHALPRMTLRPGWTRLADTVMERLRGSAEERASLGALLRDRSCYRRMTDASACRQRLAATRTDWELHEDLVAAEGDAPQVLEFLKHHRECRGSLREAPLLTGKDLIAAGHRPGPRLGRSLRHLRVLQLGGRICTPEDAWRVLESKAPPSNPTP